MECKSSLKNEVNDARSSIMLGINSSRDITVHYYLLSFLFHCEKFRLESS